MNRILLVARRDFLQIVSTRAFKITLLIVPLMLVLVPLGNSFPPPPYLRWAVPRDVPVDRGAEAFGRAIAPYLANDIGTVQGKRPLAVAVYIPARGPLRLWTNGRGDNGLIDTIQQERTHLLRMA